MNIDVNNLVKVLVHTLQTDGTIVDAARNLGISVSELSKINAKISNQNENFKKALELKEWPTNIETGFIYIGGIPLLTPQGERSGILRPGMHILGDKLPRKNKAQKYDYYEIFLPQKVVFAQYQKCRKIINGDKVSAEYLLDDNGKIKTEWVREDEDHSELIAELRQQNLLLLKTDKTKIVYYPSQWLGQIDNRMLVNVKYNWI